MSLFTQLGKTVSNGTQEITEKAKNYAELSRLNSLIIDLEKQATAHFCDLGRAYYEMYRDNEDIGDKEEINAITDIYDQIEGLKNKIAQINGVKQCPACGAEVAASSLFCNSCGAKLPSVITESSQAECPSCHTTINLGDRFCYVCGKELPNKKPVE